MLINRSIVSELRQALDQGDFKKLKESSDAASKVEKKSRKIMEKRFEDIEKKLIDALEKGKPVPEDFTFKDVIIENAFESAKSGFIVSAVHDPKRDNDSKIKKLAAKKPKAKLLPRSEFPKSLSSLMDLWDKWRKGDAKLPGRQRKIAEELKKAYLKKTQETWKRYSKDFRNGDSGEKAAIIQKVKDAGRTTFARAKTIVETETTKYYNQARKDYYDESDDVTHYLYVPIRDAATTKWCKSRQMVVYTKGTKFLRDETPPIHWNCRSEILPLTPQNPRHKKLIDDKSRRRENRSPEPLPRGWKG